jgi:trehalose synthase
VGLRRIPIAAASLERFQPLIGDRYALVEEGIERARERFRGRVVWQVNSTATGGGVVELLTGLLPYTRGAGVDARWLVLEGEAEFFRLTKRIHNLLHGSPGDGGGLGTAEHDLYRAVLSRHGAELRDLVRPGDVVMLHDPQTAGLCGAARAAGGHVIWRCHVGIDEPNDLARQAWDFLRPEIEAADLLVFSLPGFVWDGLPSERIRIVPPSIDALSPKNQDLDDDTVGAIMVAAGLESGPARGAPAFTRRDGTPSRVNRQARVWRERPLRPRDPLVVQVSRWDRLKDPAGVVEGFAHYCRADHGGHLLLAAPDPAAVSDDPEGAEVLEEVRRNREALPDEMRARVHLAGLPMEDPEENAAIVNAIQRRATVVVQKSLAEGFGLTVAEAMWKGAAMIASRVGGIKEQVVDGETGVLVDPTDLPAFGEAVDRLLTDRRLAGRLGSSARERVREGFLANRHLLQYLAIIDELLSGELR